MAVTEWSISTINGKRWLTVQVANFRICLDDPDQGVFIAVGAPIGGVGSFPALAKGDPGFSPSIQEEVDFTPLTHDDPTDSFWNLIQIAPATKNAGPVYQMQGAMHEGPPGEDGTSLLDPTDYGTPVAGRILVVNDDEDGFEYQAQKVGDRAIPASVTNAPGGSTAYTLAVIPVAAKPFDWRPDVKAQTTMTPSGSNCRADLIARLNGETTGNDVGRGFGIAGAGTERISITAGPPAGSGDSFDKVNAGEDATIYLRIERQSGSDTLQTTNTRVSVNIIEIP